MVRYFLLLPASLAMTLLAYALAPVVALFVRSDGILPNYLKWFGTTDNPNWGDKGHEERWEYSHSYWQKVAWLIRNPAYSFEWDGPLAADIGSNPTTVVYGNPWIKNRANAVAGWYLAVVDSSWNFKAVIPLWGDLAFMPEFGWKLQPWAQGREAEGKAMYVFSLRLTAFYH